MNAGARPLFWRRFWPLALLGLIGVASLPLVILPALDALVAAGRSPTRSLAVLAALSLIQPAVLVIAAAAAGAALAARLGFTSYAAGVNVVSPFASQVRRAAASGLVIGVVIVALDIALFRHFVLAPIGARPVEPILQALAGGVLYGGLSEEVMMRWGLMSFVVWLAARFVGRRGATANVAVADDAVRLPSGAFVIAIVIVALLFAAGHLPAAGALAPLTAILVLRILLLNAVAGLVFGWLYWKASLEAAMVAHASVHVVFAFAQFLGWS
jgi:CAAX prenyl protease-like protein